MGLLTMVPVDEVMYTCQDFALVLPYAAMNDKQASTVVEGKPFVEASAQSAEQNGDAAQTLVEIFSEIRLLMGSRDRRGEGLKEEEILVLHLLKNRGTMIVGDIQRAMGVLPAQMSRTIRSLENRERSLIECTINARDKRKVDVELTVAGERALVKAIAKRVGKLEDVPAELLVNTSEALEKIIQVVREKAAARF